MSKQKGKKMSVKPQRILSGRRVSLPESFLKKYEMDEGDFVYVEEKGGKINIFPAELTRKQLRS